MARTIITITQRELETGRPPVGCWEGSGGGWVAVVSPVVDEHQHPTAAQYAAAAHPNVWKRLKHRNSKISRSTHRYADILSTPKPQFIPMNRELLNYKRYAARVIRTDSHQHQKRSECYRYRRYASSLKSPV